MFICSYERDKGCVCGGHRCRMEERLYSEVPPKKKVPINIKLIRWRCMERGDSATNTNLKKRKHFSQGIKKGYKKYLEQVWFNKFNLWCILHVSHVSNPHNCQLKCVTETACFCYPIKSTRRTAHAIFRVSGSASKLSKDACLLADYSCTSGLENKNWISAFPTQTLLQPVAKVFETLYLILA